MVQNFIFKLLPNPSQFYSGQEVQFAEVYYYFRIDIEQIEKTLALVSVYSPPHSELLTLSHHTLWSCTYYGDSSLRVIDVRSIVAVIAMVPHRPFSGDDTDRFFVVEKPGLDVASLGGSTERVPDEE